MSWTTPPNFVAGTTLAAADLNDLGADLVYLKAIADAITASLVSVARSTNQSINDSTTTAITWTAEDFDFGSWWASGTDIVVPAGAIPAGFTTIIVDITARLQWASNGTGYRAVSIFLNGSLIDTSNASALSGEVTNVEISYKLEVAAADVITIRGTQTSGGALNVAKAKAQVARYAPAS